MLLNRYKKKCTYKLAPKTIEKMLRNIFSSETFGKIEKSENGFTPILFAPQQNLRKQICSETIKKQKQKLKKIENIFRTTF